MNVVGLTGGIATGKTTVTNYLTSLNVPIIDTDTINYQLLIPHQQGYLAILRQFPDVPLSEDKSLDKNYLRHKIFNDKETKQQLENILHPIIKQETFAQIASLKKTSSAPYCIVAVPLLIEANFINLVTEVWITDCTEETQIKRLMQRDKISESDAKLIMSNQLGRHERLKYADKIINTESNKSMLENVDILHKQQIKVNSK